MTQNGCPVDLLMWLVATRAFVRLGGAQIMNKLQSCKAFVTSLQTHLNVLYGTVQIALALQGSPATADLTTFLDNHWARPTSARPSFQLNPRFGLKKAAVGSLISTVVLRCFSAPNVPNNQQRTYHPPQSPLICTTLLLQQPNCRQLRYWLPP